MDTVPEGDSLALPSTLSKNVLPSILLSWKHLQWLTRTTLWIDKEVRSSCSSTYDFVVPAGVTLLSLPDPGFGPEVNSHPAIVVSQRNKDG